MEDERRDGAEVEPGLSLERESVSGDDAESHHEGGDSAAGHDLQDLVIISGFSGAGKSEAMDCFEDAGYFCVDNLPPQLILQLADIFAHPGSKVVRAAIVSDPRGGDYFGELTGVLDELLRRGLRHRVLFLEAAESELQRRFTETRRRHPLAPRGRVITGIRREQELLKWLRDRADCTIDTTELSPAMLRRRLTRELLPQSAPGRLAVTLLSFGFKLGVPRDADLLFDVRFLPNPYWEPDLRELTGRDPPVREFVDRWPGVDQFFRHVRDLLDFLLPAYIAEGKSHLTVGIGCTGGRHRSVAVAERLSTELASRDDIALDVAHRDMAA